MEHSAMGHSARPRAAAPGIAGLIIIAGLALAGCGHGASSAGAPSSNGAGSAAKMGVAGAPAAAAVPNTARQLNGQPQTGSATTLAPATQDIVYTASMTVRVASPRQAAARATAIAERAGGYVSGENAALPTGRHAGGTVSMQLKIPVAGYQAVLTELASGLGTETDLRQQAQDVTQRVADTASLVGSDETAITQLRALLRRAGSVAALLTVQEQISSQESDLESLQAQQRALDHETAYATVSLRLTSTAAVTAAAKPAPAGFTGGLAAGWHALRAAVSWLLLALGAVLPIGAALILAGLAGFRAYRRLRRVRT